MNPQICTLTSDADLKNAFPVLKELRPHLEYEEFKRLYSLAHTNEGYTLVALQSEDTILAVMGYRFITDFIRGTHLYIDDLVSTESMRSQGLGEKLLHHAEDLARKAHCKSLRLCTGTDNDGGIRFYERLGWRKRAYAYTKKID